MLPQIKRRTEPPSGRGASERSCSSRRPAFRIRELYMDSTNNAIGLAVRVYEKSFGS
jgi:hypothetical protein